MLRYHEELRLRRQPAKLQLTLRLESVGDLESDYDDYGDYDDYDDYDLSDIDMSDYDLSANA